MPASSILNEKKIPATADARNAAMVKKFGVSPNLIAIVTSGSI
jgi:hypothetical protein